MSSLLWNKLCASHDYKHQVYRYEPDWRKYIKEGTLSATFPIAFVRIRHTGSTSTIIFLNQFFHHSFRQHLDLIADNKGVRRVDLLKNGHAGYWELMKHNRMMVTVKNGLSYTIVRNPFDWLVSSYFYYKTLRDHYGGFKYFALDWIEDKNKMPDIREDPGGGIYMREMCHQNIYTPIFESDQPGARCLIPVIIRYERLEEGLNKMLEQFNTGLPSTDQGFASSRPIPHRNRSEHKKFNYKHYYEEDPVLGPKIVEGLLKKHAAEFEMFGYDFDGPIDDSVFINPANLILKY